MNHVAKGRRGWLFHDVVRPGLLLALYSAVLMATLPEGFNRRFAMIVALLACILVAGAVVVSFVLLRRRTLEAGGGASAAGDVERPQRADALLLLLPLAPVVQYMMVNRDTISPLGSVVGIAALGALAVTLALVIPYLAQRAMSRTVAMVLGLALTFVMYNMAAFAKSNHWRGPDEAVQPIALFAALVIAGVALHRYRRDVAYVIACAYFLSTVAIASFASEPALGLASDALPTASAADRDEALATIARGQADELPDIIILTYDAYVESETMRGYGIDNADQEAFLESQGFAIVRGTYTVAGDSIGTMGRLLGGSTPGEGIAGRGPLLDALRDAGYHTTGVFQSDYFFSRSEPGYDRYFPDPWPTWMTMLRGILEGRFRHDLAFSATPHDEFVEMKRSAIGSESAAPIFVYAHSGPGHSQNSGACLDDETERYAARLAEANLEMQDDIDTVLEHRPGAIVIVNGDHGPYLTKNCYGLAYGGYDGEDVTRLDIQDRFGSFLAIRWPEGIGPAEPDIEVLQDALPTVLGEVFPDIDADALRGSTRLAEGESALIAGLNVEHGVIIGGRLDGLPLFEGLSD